MFIGVCQSKTHKEFFIIFWRKSFVSKVWGHFFFFSCKLHHNHEGSNVSYSHIMPRRTRLSSEEQAQVEALHNVGFRCRRIVTEIGRSVNCISNYLKNPRRYNDRHVQGRPRIISSATSRQVKDFFPIPPSVWSEQSQTSDYQCHEWTSGGLWGGQRISLQVAKAAPRLTQAHKAARRRFVEENVVRNWDQVRNYLYCVPQILGKVN